MRDAAAYSLTRRDTITGSNERGAFSTTTLRKLRPPEAGNAPGERLVLVRHPVQLAYSQFLYVRRADASLTNRGDAVAATRIVCGEESRRGRDAESPRRRGAAATRRVRGAPRLKDADRIETVQVLQVRLKKPSPRVPVGPRGGAGALGGAGEVGAAVSQRKLVEVLQPAPSAVPLRDGHDRRPGPRRRLAKRDDRRRAADFDKRLLPGGPRGALRGNAVSAPVPRHASTAAAELRVRSQFRVGDDENVQAPRRAGTKRRGAFLLRAA